MNDLPDRLSALWDDLKNSLKDLWYDPPRNPQVSEELRTGRIRKRTDSWPESSWNKAPEPRKEERPRADKPGPPANDNRPTVFDEIARRLDKVAEEPKKKLPGPPVIDLKEESDEPHLAILSPLPPAPKAGEKTAAPQKSVVPPRRERPPESPPKIKADKAKDLSRYGGKKAGEQLLAESSGRSSKKWAAKTKSCPHCGKPILSASTVCPHCGKQESSGLMGVVGLFIVLVAILIVLGGGAVYMLQDSGSGEVQEARTAPAPAPAPASTTVPQPKQRPAQEAEALPQPKPEAQPGPKSDASPATPAALPEKDQSRETATAVAGKEQPASVAQPGRPVVNQWGMNFVPIPAGKFNMGRADMDTPHHKSGRRVFLTRPFHIQTTEVTRKQWVEVMGTSVNISLENDSGNNPVDYVSWEDARKFINRLNQLDPGYVYRLPTEAEWEYACRAGSDDRYFYNPDTDEPNSYSWNSGNTSELKPVGSKKANPWGLHDVYGNVWEWCSDWYAPRLGTGTATDPRGPDTGTEKVYRGGACTTNFRHLDSLTSGRARPEERWLTVGLRLVMEKTLIPARRGGEGGPAPGLPKDRAGDLALANSGLPDNSPPKPDRIIWIELFSGLVSAAGVVVGFVVLGAPAWLCLAGGCGVVPWHHLSGLQPGGQENTPGGPAAGLRPDAGQAGPGPAEDRPNQGVVRQYQ